MNFKFSVFRKFYQLILRLYIFLPPNSSSFENFPGPINVYLKTMIILYKCILNRHETINNETFPSSYIHTHFQLHIEVIREYYLQCVLYCKSLCDKNQLKPITFPQTQHSISTFVYTV